MSLLELDSVGLEYDDGQESSVMALEDINLRVDQGEFVVILGASGCGKTSLLNMIAGFLYPTDGKAKINNSPITGPGPDRGVVFQKNALMPWLNVEDNVELALKFAGIDKTRRKEVSEKCLNWVGLQGFKKSYIYQLSGGMQQRVGIARALASEPKMLLLDEPLGALDAITREEVQEVILGVWEKSQKTILMVTHSIEEALFMATRLIIMTPRPGRIFKTYDLSFSKDFLLGEQTKEIKQKEKFLRLKSEILRIVEEKS